MASYIRRRKFLATLGGAAATWPLAARAQLGGGIPRVGFLWHAGSREEESPYYEAAIEGFAKLGYVDGRNIIIEHRFPNEIPDRFRSMAAELVALNVDVLMGTTSSISYLRDATSKIPTVFVSVPNPVEMKLVQSLARPGGNITGFTSFGADLAAKRLQLLKELVPGLSRVALLLSQNSPVKRMYIDVTRAAADKLGLVVQAYEATTLEDMASLFDAMVKAGMQAVIVVAPGIVAQPQAHAVITKLAMARRLPLSTFAKETFEGALVSYGPSITGLFRRMAIYVDKILKGAKPGELPVEQPTTFELFIDLRVAKILGLEVPVHLQQIADGVIE